MPLILKVTHHIKVFLNEKIYSSAGFKFVDLTRGVIQVLNW